MWWAVRALHISWGVLQSQLKGLRRDATVIKQKQGSPTVRAAKGVGHNEPTATFAHISGAQPWKGQGCILTEFWLNFG